MNCLKSQCEYQKFPTIKIEELNIKEWHEGKCKGVVKEIEKNIIEIFLKIVGLKRMDDRAFTSHTMKD